MSFKHFILFCLILSFGAMLGQNKIVLSKGLKKRSFKTKQLIGVTLKGESYKYEGWRNLEKRDSVVKANFWVLDSIGTQGFKLVTFKYKVTYKLDTISGKKSTPDGDNAYILKEVLSNQVGKDGYYKVVYKVPTIDVLIDQEKRIPFDSIESFTYLKPYYLESTTHLQRLHFNFPFLNNTSPYANAGKTLFLPLICATVITGAIIEVSFNASVALIEQMDVKRVFYTKRYPCKQWKVRVKG